MKGDVLVTGAHGFLGRHVGRAAALRGLHVVGIGHGDWGQDEWQAWGFSDWCRADITVEALTGFAQTPVHIVHCAGSGSVSFSFERPTQDFERTVGTTLHVLEYARLHAPTAAMVYPSSAAVYGRASALPITEDSPLAPISPYGAHKVIAEDLCRSYARTFNLSIAIVRLFSAFGIGLRKQLLWDACRKADSGDHRFAGTGRETRDWLTADDAANLLLVAGTHADPTAPVANGASGVEVETRAILSVLFDALGSSLRPEFSGEKRPGDPERYAGDPSRAKAWGWQQEQPWDTAVRDYAHWYIESVR